MVRPSARAADDEVLLMEDRVYARRIGSVLHLQILVARSLAHGRVHVLFLLVRVLDQAAVVYVEQCFVVLLEQLVDVGGLVLRFKIAQLKIAHEAALDHFFG